METKPRTGVEEAIAEPERGLEGAETLDERFGLDGGGLREHAARGVVINSAFQVGFAALGLVQRLVLAVFLTASDYGLWGILLTTFITLSWLKQVGISDKYIQQDEPDQEAAFQKAFTLELLYTLCFWVLLVVALPVYALAYGRPEMIVPGLVLSAAIVVSAFQTPIWIAYRRMRFVRQRTLEALNPVASTIVMVALAASGFGYWSMVIGITVGSVVGSVAAVATSPYKLRWRYDPGTLREYVSFSWPLLASSMGSLVVVQGTLFAANYSVGLAGVGVIALATSFLVFADRVNGIISRTLYPAICAVKDQRQLLFEAFIKSNRLALMWGLPFGVAASLFAQDLADLLGAQWQPAVGLMQALGVVVGLRQIAFNWGPFMTATGNTRPLAVNGLIVALVFLAANAPLIVAFGLDGYIAGICLATAVELAVRAFYLRRLFPGFRMARHGLRALAPCVPAVLAVLAVRWLGPAGRPPGAALVELALYVAVTILMTMIFERSLLREIAGYLRRSPALAAAA